MSRQVGPVFSTKKGCAKFAEMIAEMTGISSISFTPLQKHTNTIRCPEFESSFPSADPSSLGDPARCHTKFFRLIHSTHFVTAKKLQIVGHGVPDLLLKILVDVSSETSNTINLVQNCQIELHCWRYLRAKGLLPNSSSETIPFKFPEGLFYFSPKLSHGCLKAPHHIQPNNVSIPPDWLRTPNWASVESCHGT